MLFLSQQENGRKNIHKTIFIVTLFTENNQPVFVI